MEKRDIDLVLQFMTSEGKVQNLRPRLFSSNLTKAVIDEAMAKMTSASTIFQRPSEIEGNDLPVTLYHKAIGAKYVDTIERKIS